MVKWANELSRERCAWEREQCAKIADELAVGEVLFAPEMRGTHPFDVARKLYSG